MSLALSILASGSSGNCGVVRCQGGVMLIDCGIGPRTAAGRMRRLGVGLADVSAICLTHLDSDHFNMNWVGEIVRRKIWVFCHAARVGRLVEQVNDRAFGESVIAFDGEFSPIAGVRVDSIHLPHDEHGSHGFLVESGACRLGYATDLGHVHSRLIQRFVGVDILAIECNYDPDMQRASGRPLFLQRRIMGGRGHLSNEQSFEAARRIMALSEQRGRRVPRHIALLHRSRQCNCPNLVREIFSRDARLAVRLTLAEQLTATEWLAAETEPLAGEQLELQWG